MVYFVILASVMWFILIMQLKLNDHFLCTSLRNVYSKWWSFIGDLKASLTVLWMLLFLILAWTSMCRNYNFTVVNLFIIGLQWRCKKPHTWMILIFVFARKDVSIEMQLQYHINLQYRDFRVILDPWYFEWFSVLSIYWIFIFKLLSICRNTVSHAQIIQYHLNLQ